jgi:hypothetical protein
VTLPDSVLLNLGPVLIVMSTLAIISPSLRRAGSWRGIGAAWLATFVVALAVALTHLDDWGLSCEIGLLRIAPTTVGAINPGEPCSGTNSLPPWLVALPPLVGIAILLAWAWRHTRPASAALRTVAVVIAGAVVIVGIGLLLDPNAALFAIVAVGVAAYAWPRYRPRRSA